MKKINEPKICINCKHHDTRYGARAPVCMAALDPVFGKTPTPCIKARKLSGPCKPAGKLYEAKA